MARVGIDDALRALQAPEALVAAWSVEVEDVLAEAVTRVWDDHHTRQGVIPYRRAAACVWDLLRNGCAHLQAVLQSVPRGCLLLIIGGWPCQQLTQAVPHRGRAGMCGQSSCLFLAVPLVAWAAQRLRPDIHVQVIGENAGSMLPRHCSAILQLLALPASPNHAPVYDSGDWTSFTRRRTLFSTLPPLPGLQPTRRPPTMAAGLAASGQRAHAGNDVQPRGTGGSHPRLLLSVPRPLPACPTRQ